MIHTYRAAILGFSPVATPTDGFVFKGSAAAIARLKKIRIFGVATAQGNMPVQVVRRSTAGTLGSAVLTALTAVSMDKNADMPQAGLWSVGTANYTTLGTLVGVVDDGRLNMSPVTTGQVIEPLVFDFTSMPLNLRGASDFICINFNGAPVPAGGLIDVVVEWDEG